MAVATTYDALYMTEGGPAGIPVEYMRALAHMESGQNPANKTGGQWGLFQMSADQVVDFNKAKGTSYTSADRLDPSINTQLWVDWYKRFEKLANATGEPNLKPDWSNPQWVLLVTAAHNGGWSSKAGLLKVAKYLQENRIPVTHANVFKYGYKAGAAWPFHGSLQAPRYKDAIAKKNWQTQVAQLYTVQKTLGLQTQLPNEESVKQAEAKADLAPSRKGGNWLWVLLLVGIAYAQSKR